MKKQTIIERVAYVQCHGDLYVKSKIFLYTLVFGIRALYLYLYYYVQHTTTARLT